MGESIFGEIAIGATIVHFWKIAIGTTIVHFWENRNRDDHEGRPYLDIFLMVFAIK